MADQEPDSTSPQPGRHTVLDADTRRARKLMPQWHVILWDDADHTYRYVQAMMMELFGYSAEQSWQIAVEGDGTGRAVVCTTHKERAEFKAEQIHAYGDDPWMGQGPKRPSMRTSIEPAD